ncbi:MAG: type VI secretion system tube protein Hcp [Planctomycetia bacterium]|nr:type VI secretion system tube protein Hcp [Planctomycetia bacterium]
MRDSDKPDPLELQNLGAFARVDGFVKIGDFEGSAKGQGHDGWSTLVGLRLDVQRATGSFIGSDKAVGSVQFAPIAVRKFIDGASPKVFKSCLDGRKHPKVQIHVTRTIGGKPQVAVEIELEEVNVSAYRVDDGAVVAEEEPATDTTELRFHKMTYTVHKFDQSGNSQGKVQETYTVGS